MSGQLDKIRKLKTAQAVLLVAYFGAVALFLIAPYYNTIIENLATGLSFVAIGSIILTSCYIYSLDTNDSELKNEP